MGRRHDKSPPNVPRAGTAVFHRKHAWIKVQLCISVRGFTAPCWNDSCLSLRSPCLFMWHYSAGVHAWNTPLTAAPRCTGTICSQHSSTQCAKSTTRICSWKLKPLVNRRNPPALRADSEDAAEHQELGDISGHWQRVKKKTAFTRMPQVFWTLVCGRNMTTSVAVIWWFCSVCHRKTEVPSRDVRMALPELSAQLINPLNCSFCCNFWNTHLVKPCRSISMKNELRFPKIKETCFN